MVWLTCTHECFPTMDWRPMKEYKISHHPKRSFRCPTFSTSFSQVFQAMSQIIWALSAALKVHNSSSVKSKLYSPVWQVNIVQLLTKTYKGELQHMSKKILFFASTWWEYITHNKKQTNSFQIQLQRVSTHCAQVASTHFHLNKYKGAQVDSAYQCCVCKCNKHVKLRKSFTFTHPTFWHLHYPLWMCF
jgi:hypothetical protein